MAETNQKKRPASQDGGSKRRKKGKYYDAKSRLRQTLMGIEPRTQGIFATCVKGREARCVEELYSLFDKYTEQLYGPFESGREGSAGRGGDEEGNGDGDMDIEAMMARELEGIRSTGQNGGDWRNKLFISVKIDAQCIVYFRTNAPIQPSSFVHAICTDFASSGTRQSRWTSRLTPIERTGKATVEGIEEVAKHVLKPWFHEGQTGVAFAIKPTLRHHDVLTRDIIITTVARCVGQSHRVDLKNYDVLILVEVYKNICGMSIVKDWEKLKRFNLAQIQEGKIGDKSRKPGGQDPHNKTEADNVAQTAMVPHGEEDARISGSKQQDPGELAIFSVSSHVV